MVEDITEKISEIEAIEIIEGEEANLPGESHRAAHLPQGEMIDVVSKIAACPHAAALAIGSQNHLQENSEVVRAVVPRGEKGTVDRPDDGEVLSVGVGVVGDQERSGVTVEIEAAVPVAHL